MNKEQFRKLVQERFIFSDGTLRPEWSPDGNLKGMKAVEKKTSLEPKNKYIADINTLYLLCDGHLRLTKIIYSTPHETYIFFNDGVYKDGWNTQKFSHQLRKFSPKDENSFQRRKHPISFQNQGKGWSLMLGESAFVLDNYIRPNLLNWINENPLEVKQ